MRALTTLGWRQGLKRYRDDRLGLLGELGAARCDLAFSRLGSIRLYLVTCADLAQTVLLERAANYKKSRALNRFARPLLGDGLISSEGAVHKRNRKLLAPGFQARRISRYAADMVALTTEMLAGWQAGEPRDFAHEIMGLTVRIAAKTMFGDAAVPADEVGAALEIANRWVMTEASSLIPIPLAVPTPRNLAMKAALARLDAIVYDVIERKRARWGSAGAADEDILSMLLAAQGEDGAGLSDLQVRDEVMTFFMAGHETTATALSWMFHALATHPQICRTLTDELDTVLEGRAPTFADLEQLPYLRQVTHETLRMFPPAYMIGREATVDTELDGHAVAVGTYVLINVFGIHRRRDYHAEPLAFRPERFVEGEASGAPRGGYLPFGLGPRVCIGNQFAMMESCLLAAAIFQRISPAATGAPVGLDPLITLRPDPGLPFAVRWRG